MHITHLSLANFRNYRSLELDLPSHLVVLQGDNAQGKSNFLEALYLLATAKSHRATTERELISWDASGDGQIVARTVAQVQKREGQLKVELTLTLPQGGTEGHVHKRIRINGVPRRAVDLVGQVNVVLFSSHDIELIGGPPSLRRRYLDITNSQVDSRYLRALQRYNKVLLQRNHLLRLIGEGRGEGGQLDFWDRELVEHGSYIIAQRQLAVAELNRLAQPIHDEISSGESVEIGYLPSVSQDFEGELKGLRGREVARGMSLLGPHRDDMSFAIDNIDMNTYGSRGQQRTIALSLKLAEARFLQARSGEEPIILLDDVLSELDAERRRHLLESVAAYQQVVLTATDLDHFSPDFLGQAALLRVSRGSITPA